MTNIHQIVSEDDLKHFIETNQLKLITIMFSTKLCEPCKKIRPTFISLSKQYKDTEFVYIDLSEFKEDTYHYTNKYDIQYTPYFIFLFNNKKLGHSEGDDSNNLISVLKELRNKVLNAQADNASSKSEEYVLDNEEVIQNKLKLMAQMYVLAKNGYGINLNYSLLSNYDEMNKEYQHWQKKYENSLDEKQRKILAIQKLRLEEKKMKDQKNKDVHKLIEMRNKKMGQ